MALEKIYPDLKHLDAIRIGCCVKNHVACVHRVNMVNDPNFHGVGAAFQLTVGFETCNFVFLGEEIGGHQTGYAGTDYGQAPVQSLAGADGPWPFATNS